MCPGVWGNYFIVPLRNSWALKERTPLDHSLCHEEHHLFYGEIIHFIISTIHSSNVTHWVSTGLVTSSVHESMDQDAYFNWGNWTLCFHFCKEMSYVLSPAVRPGGRRQARNLDGFWLTNEFKPLTYWWNHRLNFVWWWRVGYISLEKI